MNSMTGFGKGEASGPNFALSVEIKSVNHRFKDVRFKMSSLFNAKEIELRKLIDKNFKRGSFDIYINFKKQNNVKTFDDLDEEKVKAYINQIKEICGDSATSIDIRATEFLRPEFYKDKDEHREQELYSLVDTAIVQAINSLQESRAQEGAALMKVLEDHKQQYASLFQTIETNAHDFEKGIREKILAKFEEYKEQLDQTDNRFSQEIIYYMEKIDIHEEINRIKTHITKLEEILLSKKEVGRQLDFLIQELNRETNTIGSKSSIAQVSEAVIQMKSQLEKIREQALNLE